MPIDDFQTTLKDEVFAGNAAAFEGLTRYIKEGRVTAFTGAGVSVPLYPTWTTLLSQTLDSAIADGLVTNSDEIREYREMLENDPLELADFMEQVRSDNIFRAKLADIFRSKQGSATELHRLISRLKFRGIVTLNYDSGHETAYAGEAGRNPNTGKAQDTATLARRVRPLFVDATRMSSS